MAVAKNSKAPKKASKSSAPEAVESPTRVSRRSAPAKTVQKASPSPSPAPIKKKGKSRKMKG